MFKKILLIFCLANTMVFAAKPNDPLFNKQLYLENKAVELKLNLDIYDLNFLDFYNFIKNDKIVKQNIATNNSKPILVILDNNINLNNNDLDLNKIYKIDNKYVYDLYNKKNNKDYFLSENSTTALNILISKIDNRVGYTGLLMLNTPVLLIDINNISGQNVSEALEVVYNLKNQGANIRAILTTTGVDNTANIKLLNEQIRKLASLGIVVIAPTEIDGIFNNICSIDALNLLCVLDVNKLINKTQTESNTTGVSSLLNRNKAPEEMADRSSFVLGSTFDTVKSSLVSAAAFAGLYMNTIFLYPELMKMDQQEVYNIFNIINFIRSSSLAIVYEKLVYASDGTLLPESELSDYEDALMAQQLAEQQAQELADQQQQAEACAQCQQQSQQQSQNNNNLFNNIFNGIGNLFNSSNTVSSDTSNNKNRIFGQRRRNRQDSNSNSSSNNSSNLNSSSSSNNSSRSRISVSNRRNDLGNNIEQGIRRNRKNTNSKNINQIANMTFLNKKKIKIVYLPKLSMLTLDLPYTNSTRFNMPEIVTNIMTFPLYYSPGTFVVTGSMDIANILVRDMVFPNIVPGIIHNNQLKKFTVEQSNVITLFLNNQKSDGPTIDLYVTPEGELIESSTIINETSNNGGLSSGIQSGNNNSSNNEISDNKENGEGSTNQQVYHIIIEGDIVGNVSLTQQ